MARKTEQAIKNHNERERIRSAKKVEERRAVKERKAKDAEYQRQQRAKKKQQQSSAPSAPSRPSLPPPAASTMSGESGGRELIPVVRNDIDNATPRPVETPAHPHGNSNSTLAQPTTPSWQSFLPPAIANATPEQVNRFMSLQVLAIAAHTSQGVVAEVSRIRAEESAAPRNLTASMNEAQSPPPQPQLQLAANPVSITPEPFPMDYWHVSSREEFASLCTHLYQTLTTLDRSEAELLCLRFLAHAVVEYEDFFDFAFVNHPDMPLKT
jgi:hypothetical protein